MPVRMIRSIWNEPRRSRVTGRVEEDPEAAVGGRLVIMAAGSGSQHRRLGRIDAGHRKVQVELLGVDAAR